MCQAEWGIATGKRNFRKMVSLGPQIWGNWRRNNLENSMDCDRFDIKT